MQQELKYHADIKLNKKMAEMQQKFDAQNAEMIKQ